MKNYKQFIAGVIVGGVLLTTGNVLAENNTLPTITNWVKYTFNGKEKPVPSGYTTLNYEGRTYVPARFIAEELGADVKWDANSNTVIVEKKESTPPLDSSTTNKYGNEGTSTETTTQKPTINYEELPVSKTIDGVRVEVYSIETTDQYTKLYVIVKNTTEKLVQLNQESAYLKTENDTYAHKAVKGNILYWKDTSWYTDIREDKDTQGYIMIPRLSNDDHQGEIYVEVVENGFKPNVLQYRFNIKW